MKSWKNSTTFISAAVAVIGTLSLWTAVLLMNIVIPPVADFFYARPYYVAGGTVCILFAVVRWISSE